MIWDQKARADEKVVGLASDASRFFKFLLIIVEFSIAMVLFVSSTPDGKASELQ